MWKWSAILMLPLLAVSVAPPAQASEADLRLTQNPNYTPAPPKEGYSYPDCFCTDSDGRRVELGQTACLTIGTRQVLARCEMSVNNPAWRNEVEGCPGV